jgi:hypothetical protein
MAEALNSNWTKAGALLGGLLLAYSHFDLASRVDTGKDQQTAHWQQERAYKDSCDRANDERDFADRQYLMRQNDTEISLLRKK